MAWPLNGIEAGCNLVLISAFVESRCSLIRGDPGGGTPLRNDVTDGEVKKFKSEYVYTNKKASSQGGGVRTPAPSP